MSNEVMKLRQTVRSIRPVVPAKIFEVSKRFYVDLGFQPQPLTDNLVEMHLGAYAFILQDYYVQQWADNFVMHMLVSDLRQWWNDLNFVCRSVRKSRSEARSRHPVWSRSARATDRDVAQEIMGLLTR
jgi:hypothetical protein